jgi:hypothetical protein
MSGLSSHIPIFAKNRRHEFTGIDSETGMNRRVTIVVVVGTLAISLSKALYSQHPSAEGKIAESGTIVLAAAPQAPSAEAWSAVERRLDSIDQTLRSSNVEFRLAGMEKAIGELKRSSLLGTLLPAIIAAVAAVLGLLIGGLLQDRLQRARLVQEEKIANAKAEHEKGLAEARAKQDRELAEKQSKLQIGNAVVEWQLKQLSLLYGPVRALLGQSFGLYRQMNIVLERADSDRFRFVNDPHARGQNAEQGQVFQIRRSSQDWERFRTVMHIDEVYGRGYGVETYFDEVVSIGARIVKIIEQNAGYARPEEEQLMNVFAQYLAHFAVLNHLHGLAKAALERPRSKSHDAATEADSLTQLKVDVSAVFPTELHDLINAGFKAITKDIEQWREKAVA